MQKKSGDGKLLIKVSVSRKLPDHFQFKGMIQTREREKQATLNANKITACGVQYFEIEFIL